MNPETFIEQLKQNGVTFFAGVPDSLLTSFCSCIADRISGENHIICANEGAAVGIAIGYHLATKAIPLVYMQNSGIGNAVNPLLSLADAAVYSIPIVLMIGWRGEPGLRDEPQHTKQGRVLLDMLRSMEIPCELLGEDADCARIATARAISLMRRTSAPHALVVRKGCFDPYPSPRRQLHDLGLTREDAIRIILDALDPADVLVSTTGMASREIFEYREKLGQGHSRDFLTVGGMGHASQIALGIACQKPDRRVICIDGDGALIMHMGSMAIIGARKNENFKHIVINNGAHDSVGGQPTVGFHVDLKAIAEAAGYGTVIGAASASELRNALEALARARGPFFLEIRVRQGHRADLGRPTATPAENKIAFMKFLK